MIGIQRERYPGRASPVRCRPPAGRTAYPAGRGVCSHAPIEKEGWARAPAPHRIHAAAAVGAAVAGQGSIPDAAALVATAAYHTIQGALDLLPWRGLWSPDCLPDPDTAVGAACPMSEAACAGAPAARAVEPPRAISLDSLLPAALIDLAVPLAAVDATLYGADRDFQWHSPVGIESAHPFSRLALGMLPAWMGWCA